MQTDGGVPEHVLDAYGVVGAGIEMLSGGRTNRTMRVRAGRDLVLQHLRGDGHADLLGVMENLVRVTAHLDWKHRMRGLEAGERAGATWWPELVSATTGKPFIMTDSGDVWRAYAYRHGRIARDVLPLATLEHVAGLFGRFARETIDLDGPELIETAPGFHDLSTVWAEFEHLVDGAHGSDELRWLEPHLDELDLLRTQLDGRCSADGLGGIRHRVVHNDTKISNALLHPSEPQAIAVLDLDLVMMGPIWHDLGDLLRSVAWHLNSSGPALAPDDFERLLRAFVTEAGDTLLADEIATAAVAGPRLSLELGVRYMSDHLRADPVLRVRGERGHLLRGLANVKLATEMLNAYDALRSVVDTVIADR